MGASPLLVVGWPGADWSRLHPLLDAGLLPAFGTLVECGVSGPLAAGHPLTTVPLWTTLATGLPATVHGVLHDAEVEPTAGDVRPATALSWRVPALWHKLAQAGQRCCVLGWPATHPGASLPQGGVLVSDSYGRPTALPDAAGVGGWPLLPGAVNAADPEVAATLADLRVSPAEIDPVLLAEFIPRWQELDFAQDTRPRRLAVALAETWSLHNAATFLLEAVRPDVLFVHYPLLERLAALFLPCAADGPAPGRISPWHAERFGDVLPAACRWLDGCLHRLQVLAGPHATTLVVSPSGYRSPAVELPLVAETFPPTAHLPGWRLPVGMFAVAGEGSGVRRDALAHRLSVYDVAPLLARLAGLREERETGLPSARWIEEEIFDPAVLPPSRPAQPTGEPTFKEAVATASLPNAGSFDIEQSRSFRAQWLLTGEWPEVPTLGRVLHDSNLALARAWSAQPGGEAFARRILERMHAEQPEDPTVAFALVECLLRLEELPAARAAAETVFDHRWGSAQAELLRGHFAYCGRRYQEALSHFQTAGELGGDALAGWENQLGLALLKLGRFAEAESAYGRSLRRQPDDADAHLGQGHARLRLGNYSGAAEASRAAVSLRYDYPLAHLNLGVALARLGHNGEAMRELETVLRLLTTPEWSVRSERADPLAVHAQRILSVLRNRSSASWPGPRL